ncbi:MAG: cation transporter [Anaerotardibacter sp.]
MKKAFELENLDCANCAAKMETALNKLPEITTARVTFMTQKLILETEKDSWDEILDLAQAEISKIEKDCRIVR